MPLPIKARKVLDLTNKDDDHKENYKKMFEKLVKERFDEIIELTDEMNQNDLIYYLKGNTARKRFDDFNNDIKLLKKQSLLNWS